MKKTYVLVSIFSLLLVLALATLATTYFETPKSTDVIDALPQSTSYFCSEGKTFSATFDTRGVTLTLSPNEILTLPNAMSASGARYESTDETSGTTTVFWTKGDNAFITRNGTDIYSDCVGGTTTSSGDVTTFTPGSKMFSISYPSETALSGGGMGYSTAWMNMSTTSGLVLAKITLPRSSQPKTNFSEGVLTLGTSGDPVALAECTDGKSLNNAKTDDISIGGMPYTKFVYSDAGAGNFYETTSYRMLMHSQCYVLEYTIHTTNIHNYSPDQGIEEYDSKKVHDLFEKIVASVMFSEIH